MLVFRIRYLVREQAGKWEHRVAHRGTEEEADAFALYAADRAMAGAAIDPNEPAPPLEARAPAVEPVEIADKDTLLRELMVASTVAKAQPTV
ncbi:hypothetical protein [Marinobacter shengliensis]|uniref:hypothetical protein n=1 Tax=Marinobacter shengliensis TaxID=1389223 RepID=UPI00110972A9|nr:hypothetical protein [Marinobacter shengliensis]